MNNPKIIVAGAGNIGCFVGGLLLLADNNVAFLGRDRIATELREHGLTLTDYSGMNKRVPPEMIEMTEEPAILNTADLILVTVKSGATEEIASLISQHAENDCIIVSLKMVSQTQTGSVNFCRGETCAQEWCRSMSFKWTTGGSTAEPAGIWLLKREHRTLHIIWIWKTCALLHQQT